MPFTYKTVFVPAVLLPPSQSSFKYYDGEVDGIHFANDISAAIEEQVENGYSLFSTEAITSSKYYGRVFTEGMILIFKKIDD